jgi:hypothetical protein
MFFDLLFDLRIGRLVGITGVLFWVDSDIMRVIRFGTLEADEDDTFSTGMNTNLALIIIQ